MGDGEGFHARPRTSAVPSGPHQFTVKSSVHGHALQSHGDFGSERCRVDPGLMASRGISGCRLLAGPGTGEMSAQRRRGRRLPRPGPQTCRRMSREHTLDTITTLQSLGLEIPSVAYIVGVCLFSILGWIAYRRGKKTEQPRTKWLGVALMFYPYAVSATWLLYVVGAALCAGIYVDKKGLPW